MKSLPAALVAALFGMTGWMLTESPLDVGRRRSRARHFLLAQPIRPVVVTDMGSAMDFLPTAAKLAGADPPAEGKDP